MMTDKLCVLLFAFTLAATPLARADDYPEFDGVDLESAILKEAYVSSKFGVRQDPYRKRPSWHGGIDLGADWNEGVYAPAKGVVESAETVAGYGKRVDLKLANGWTIRFAHLKEMNVVAGQQIDAGAQIGVIGSVGRATGPHVHLETLYEGKQYNPVGIPGLRFFEKERSKPSEN